MRGKIYGCQASRKTLTNDRHYSFFLFSVLFSWSAFVIIARQAADLLTSLVLAIHQLDDDIPRTIEMKCGVRVGVFFMVTRYAELICDVGDE